MNIFKKYAAAVCVPPIKEDIFLDLEASIRRENLIRRFFQRLIKDFTLLIYGQFKLDKTTIPNKKMKILWIHYGRLNIGDLLMDFSPRFLFDNKKFTHEVKKTDVIGKRISCVFRSIGTYRSIDGKSIIGQGAGEGNEGRAAKPHRYGRHDSGWW